MNINKENTIFVCVAKDNNFVNYYEPYFQAKALGIEIINAHIEDIHKIDKYENVIFYNFPLIYFGGKINELEQCSIETLNYLYKEHKNIIIYVDITFSTIKAYKRGLQLLNLPEVDINYKTMSQEDFSTTLSRLYDDISNINENPTYGIFYGMGQRKGRVNKLNEYIYKGTEDFYVLGAGISKYRPKDKQIFINFLDKKNVPYKDYMKILNNSYCTLMIQDDSWKTSKSEYPSWRFMEAWTQSCICFIDNDMDPDHKWLKGNDWFYINSFNDLYTKYREIKEDPKKRIEKLKYQEEMIKNFDKEQYTKNYWNYLNNL